MLQMLQMFQGVRQTAVYTAVPHMRSSFQTFANPKSSQQIQATARTAGIKSKVESDKDKDKYS